MLIALTALLFAPALAQEVEAYHVDSFGPPGGEPLADRDGWINGYAPDPWRGHPSRARTMTDDNSDDAPAPAYGRGGARDNWIVNGPDGRNVRISAVGYNEDDDFLGIVFRHSDGANFYLVGISADAAPPPSARLGFTGYVMLYRIQGGEGEVLAREPVSDYNNVDIEVTASEGEIRVLANGVRITVVDPDPLPAGQVGFYGYDTGWEPGWGATDAWFNELDWAWLDRDLDGVPDDIDNCPDDYNPDQADSNGNGIGDVCDESFEPDPDDPDPDDPDPDDPDPDDPDPDDPDPDDPGNGDPDDPGDGDPSHPQVELTSGGCSCDSGVARSAGWLLGLLPLLLLRRQRDH